MKTPKFNRIRPTLGRIVLEMLEEDDVLESGIILPSGKQTSTHIGIVREVSKHFAPAPDDTDRLAGPNIPVGQYVVINKYTGTEITLGRGSAARTYIACYESDVIATVHEEPADV